MKKLLTICVLCILSVSLYAQSIVVTSGSLDPLKGEKVLKFEFTYEEMLVGKLTEAEYVIKKVDDFNKKEAGKGETWRTNWYADRQNRYEPKFAELFNKYMEDAAIVAGSEGARYVFLMNTDFSEPGWNVGVMRQNASIDLSIKVKEIATGNQVASIKIRNSSANNFWGTDFDSGYRLQESYGKAGRELAKFLIKKGKIDKQ